MNTKYLNWQSALGALISFLLILLFFGFAIFISISLIAMAIVPLTWIFGKLTGQSYGRVCDNSEILYQLNKFGQWSIVATIGILAIYGMIHYHYRP